MRSAVIHWATLCALIGCAAEEQKFGTESHFASECDTSSECGAELRCLEGRCTRECDTDAVCTALEPTAYCAVGVCSPSAVDATADGTAPTVETETTPGTLERTDTLGEVESTAGGEITARDA